jgi:hypothetical protein
VDLEGPIGGDLVPADAQALVADGWQWGVHEAADGLGAIMVRRH